MFIHGEKTRQQDERRHVFGFNVRSETLIFRTRDLKKNNKMASVTAVVSVNIFLPII